MFARSINNNIHVIHHHHHRSRLNNKIIALYWDQSVMTIETDTKITLEILWLIFIYKDLLSEWQLIFFHSCQHQVWLRRRRLVILRHVAVSVLSERGPIYPKYQSLPQLLHIKIVVCCGTGFVELVRFSTVLIIVYYWQCMFVTKLYMAKNCTLVTKLFIGHKAVRWSQNSTLVTKLHIGRRTPHLSQNCTLVTKL